MDLIGTRSWKIGTDEPQSLLFALYVRDVCGLQPSLEPAIPRLEPAVPAAPVAPGGAVASEQWASWWQLLLEGGGFWTDDKRPAGLPQLTQDPEIQRLFYWGSRFAPPDFQGLADMPELRELVRRCFDAAREWSESRHHEFASLTSLRRRGSPESDIVRTVESALGRTVQPFALDIRVLPVASTQGWRLTPSRALVTEALYREPATYRAWLQPIIEELA